MSTANQPQNKHWIESDDTARQRLDQTRSLKECVRKNGLKFEAYLPPGLAEWVLNMVEQGEFVDPSEAVFVFMGQAHDIEQTPGLKHEILRRILDTRVASANGGRTYSLDEVKAHLAESMQDRGEPPVWEKVVQAE